MTRNQASGGESVRAALSQALRHSAAETRAAPVGRRPSGPLPLPLTDQPGQPVTCVHAVTHCWNGTQSGFPLSHCARGVFQNLIVLK